MVRCQGRMYGRPAGLQRMPVNLPQSRPHIDVLDLRMRNERFVKLHMDFRDGLVAPYPVDSPISVWPPSVFAVPPVPDGHGTVRCLQVPSAEKYIRRVPFFPVGLNSMMRASSCSQPLASSVAANTHTLPSANSRQYLQSLTGSCSRSFHSMLDVRRSMFIFPEFRPPVLRPSSTLCGFSISHKPLGRQVFDEFS